MVSLDQIVLRPSGPADLPLLQRLYASARELEMSALDWPAAQKSEFLQQQFRLQHQFYQQHYADARFDVIELRGAGIGRLYHQWRPDELRLMDIALLPDYRGQGIGSQLLGWLMARAAERKVPIVLHVEPYNPAVTLYDRLGFRVRGDNGVYLQMAWQPSETAAVNTDGAALAVRAAETESSQ